MSASDFTYIEPRDRNPTFELSLEMDQQVVATDAGSAPELQAVTVNNAANANPLPPPEPVPYQEVYLNPTEQVVDDGNAVLSMPELKARLMTQLEYYFSSANLANDEYLVSQMDSENYVLIATVAQFNLVKKLTNDINLIVEVLRESKLVQVDDSGEKVRANPRTNILILREIPESTPPQEIQELFSGEDCPKYTSCEFAHNDTWYVLFETDSDTSKAYAYLREKNVKFHGVPVAARIKARAITNAPYTSHKNGANQPQEQDSYAAQSINPPQNHIPFAYANVPNDGYNNQAICTPFYPPTMLQAWAPNTPPCVDLGTVLSVNGLSPQAAFRPLNSNSNRNIYAPRERPVKAYTPQNYNFSRSEQNRYLNRGQSTSYLQRQQLHQQAASFPNIVNTNSFDYMGYPASRSRNLPNFGADVNTFFTAPNLYYGKVPALYPAITSQTRHTPVMISGRQVGINAINCQDPSYVAVGNSNSLPYSKDSGVATGGGKQGADSQVKENWVPNQRQPRKKWWKENGGTGASRNYSENSSSSYHKQMNESEVKPESPKFDLETTSFPPLPGSMNTTDIIDVECYERCLSDIVKGVKPTTRDSKTQTSESALVCSMKDSSTITIEDAIIPTDGAFTPPASPENLAETVSASEPVGVENCQDLGDWEDFAESPADNTLCNTVNSMNTVPETPAAFCASNSQAFHPVSTSSLVNGSVTTTESAPSAPSTLPDAEPIVPNDIPERPAVKMPKTKPLESLPKGSRSPCDLPSPKNNKVLDASKNKYDSRPVVSKHRTSFSSSKTSDSSSTSKERANDFVPANTKTQDHCALKSSDTLVTKEKPVQGHKNKVIDTHKGRCTEAEPAQLSVNGHADSESAVSSEDEKQQQPPLTVLTYLEVAKRAKDKMVMINQEQKEKDRQDAIVRQHKQQDTVAQSRWTFQRVPERPCSRPPPRI